MSEAVVYNPSEWQRRFHNTTRMGINEVLGAGAAGPGKTYALLGDIFDQVVVEHERCANPKHKHALKWGQSTGWALHLRRTRLNLEQTIALSHKLFKAIDPGAQWNEQKSTWTFTSGFRYQFGHCKDPNDWESFMSFEFSAIYFDELTQFNEEQYDQICTRLRSSDPVLSLMLKIRAMSNPLMRREGADNFTINDPNWVRRRFVDKAPQGNVVFKKKLTRKDGTVEWYKTLYMPAKLHDNPNKDFVKQYEIKLLNSPPHIRQALLEGDWYVTEGSFFAEYWNKTLHVIQPFKCPRDWRFFRSMDWGFKVFGCIHWFAIDEEETLYCIRELKFKNKLDVEVAEMVKQYETDLGLWDTGRKCSRITGVADTQIFEQRGQSGVSIGENFRLKGVPWEGAKKGPGSNRQHAANIIKRLTDHDDGTKSPGLVIFEGCRYIIATLPAIQTSLDDPEEPQSGGDDHGYDCLRGDTLVTTAHGPVPISQVQHGDRVMSTDGNFYPCDYPRMTRRDAKLLRVDLGDRELIATPNHRILCADGVWRRVDELRTGMYAFSPWNQSSSVKRSKNLTGSAITYAASIFRALASGFTGLFGRRNTGGLSPVGITSTTWMKTDLTMPQEIWSYFSVASTSGSTWPGKISRGSVRFQLKVESWPRSGTAARRGSSGTESMSQIPSGSPENPGKPCVRSVVTRFWIRALAALQFIARGHATRSSEETLELTTLSAYALPAGSRSWQTGTVVPRPVHGDAVRVCGVTDAAPADVYCLGVKGMGAFVAAGVVVSNCFKYGVTRANRGRVGIPEVRKLRMPWEEDDEVAQPARRGRHGYGQELC